MFCIVEWTLENQFSVISFKNIVSPLRQWTEYAPDDKIQAKWGRGKTAYPARIVRISDDQGKLTESLTETIEEQLRLKPVHDSEENSVNKDPGSINTVPSTSSVQSQNEDHDDSTATDKKRAKTTKQKSAKQQKEDLAKAASNLELVELAIEKSAFQAGDNDSVSCVMRTPTKNVSPAKMQSKPAPTNKHPVQNTPSPRRSPRHILRPQSERPSTSSVLGSAFRTLNTSGDILENRLPVSDSDQIRQKLAALESWLFSLQQELNQQREFLNWFYNEQQKRNMNSTPQTQPLNTSSTYVQDHCIMTQPMQTTESGTPQPECNEPAKDSCAKNVTGSQIFTKDQLISLIKNVTDFSKGAKLLFKKLYTPEEVVGRSLKGQRANQGSNVKPALENQSKLEFLYDVVQEKWPFATRAMINCRLADVMKPSASRR